MPQFTVRGQIVPFSSGQWNIRVQNAEELREFWDQEGITTIRDWAGDAPPLVTISKRDLVSLCQAGDEVEYVFETQDRSNGRGIRGVSIRVLSPDERSAE